MTYKVEYKAPELILHMETDGKVFDDNTKIWDFFRFHLFRYPIVYKNAFKVLVEIVYINKYTHEIFRYTRALYMAMYKKMQEQFLHRMTLEQYRKLVKILRYVNFRKDRRIIDVIFVGLRSIVNYLLEHNMGDVIDMVYQMPYQAKVEFLDGLNKGRSKQEIIKKLREGTFYNYPKVRNYQPKTLMEYRLLSIGLQPDDRLFKALKDGEWWKILKRKYKLSCSNSTKYMFPLLYNSKYLEIDGSFDFNDMNYPKNSYPDAYASYIAFDHNFEFFTSRLKPISLPGLDKYKKKTTDCIIPRFYISSDNCALLGYRKSIVVVDDKYKVLYVSRLTKSAKIWYQKVLGTLKKLRQNYKVQASL